MLKLFILWRLKLRSCKTPLDHFNFVHFLIFDHFIFWGPISTGGWGTFCPISQEPEFSLTCGFCKMMENHPIHLYAQYEQNR